MNQIIVTVGLCYFNRERVCYPVEESPVEFGPYIFENPASREDWQRQFRKELEKLILEFGLKPNYVIPVFLDRGGPEDVMNAPPPRTIMDHLRRASPALILG